MRRPVIALVVVVAVGALGAGGWALKEHHERSGIVKRSERACGTLDQPDAGAPAQLPLGLPTTAGESVLRVTTQGKTTIAFAKIAGGRSDIVAVRDRVLADLRGAHYTVTGTDQEPSYEAEARLGGTHTGTLKVSPLCTGLLEVRYSIQL